MLAQDQARGDLSGEWEAKLTPSTPAEVFWLLVSLMMLVFTLDRPYRGPLAVKPTAIAGVARDAAAEHGQAHTQALPCDDQGVPLQTG